MNTYKASETPMASYLQTHLALQNLRNTRPRGPRVVIVGTADTGKTSLCRILLSYALKHASQPLFVDLDPQQGTLSIPTTIGAMVVDRMDIYHSTMGVTQETAPPLIYSYGHEDPRANREAYKRLISRLSAVCQQRSDEDGRVCSSGLLIDTYRWQTDCGMELLRHTIDAFECDVVLAVGHERLYNELRQKLERPSVSIIRLPKSGGVVDRDKTYHRHLQMQRVREYFYGTARSELAPYSTVVPFSEIAVRRIGESSPGAASGVGGMLAAPSSTLPLGMEVREQSEAEKLALLQIQPGDILLHSILAISHADVPLPNANSSQSDETVKVLETNVAGFVYVARVEEKRKRMFVLAPMPGKLPGRYLWLGTLRWAEM